MHKKKISEELIRWKNSDRKKALVIRGLRRIGKTCIVEFSANFPGIRLIFGKNMPEPEAP